MTPFGFPGPEQLDRIKTIRTVQAAAQREAITEVLYMEDRPYRRLFVGAQRSYYAPDRMFQFIISSFTAFSVRPI